MGQQLKTLVPEWRDNAVRALKGAFTWKETEEGHEYWQEVVDRLNSLEVKREFTH